MIAERQSINVRHVWQSRSHQRDVLFAIAGQLSSQAPRSRVSEDHVDPPIDAVAQEMSLFRPM